MRILFVGTVHFSRAALAHLVGMKAQVVGVATREQSDFNADHTDISDIAIANDIPYKYVNDINHPNNLEWIKSLSPDVIFCFGWSSLLKRDLLAIPRMGVIGYHPTLLPYNRGRHPIIWTLVLGLEETGSTFFFMDEGADTGDILSQRRVIVRQDDDAQSLYDRLTTTAMEQLSEFVPALRNNQFERTKQDVTIGNVWRKRGVADGKIDWRMSTEQIVNLVRALAKPYPGAHIDRAGGQEKIWKAVPGSCADMNIEPGKILDIKDDRILVKSGNGAVWLTSHEIKLLPKIGDYL
jgi:methionyl-tRNA formyltransferase